MKLILYLVVIQCFPKDSLDNSYKYIAVSNTNKEYTVFTTKHFNQNDTIFVHKKRKL